MNRSNTSFIRILGVEVRHFRAPGPLIVRATAASRDQRNKVLYLSGMGKLEALLDKICWDAEIPVATVRGRNGTKPVSAVRRTFARQARRMGYTVSMIAAVLNRHHTSICDLLK